MAGAGPEINATYVLTSADGTRAVFNDHTDPDFVGMLTSLSGFDSPEVRESFDDIVEFDGGLHGPFFYGRRPMTLEGLSYGHETATQRNTRLSRLKRASDALREDATLTWTPSGSPHQLYAKVRRQQPLRIDGAWNKTFQIPLVAEDPRFYSVPTFEVEVDAADMGGVTGALVPGTYPLDFGGVDVPPSGGMSVDTLGDSDTYPTYAIFGPGSNPFVYNSTNGSLIVLTTDVDIDEAIVIDTQQRTVDRMTLDANGDPDPATALNIYSTVQPTETTWGGLEAGVNSVRLGWEESDFGAKLRVTFKAAWL